MMKLYFILPLIGVGVLLVSAYHDMMIEPPNANEAHKKYTLALAFLVVSFVLWIVL